MQVNWTSQREKNGDGNGSSIRVVVSSFDSMLMRLYFLNKS